MLLIHTYVIIAMILPLIIHSDNENVDHDLYFEVLEPFDINYTFRCRRAKDFGTKFDHLLENIYLVPTKPLKGCSRLQNHLELKGHIALIERGDCSFISKTLHAEESGALAVIIMNHELTDNDASFLMTEDFTKRNVQIPAMFLQYKEGRMFLNSIGKNNLIGVRINIPLNLTHNNMWKERKTRGFSSL